MKKYPLSNKAAKAMMAAAIAFTPLAAGAAGTTTVAEAATGQNTAHFASVAAFEVYAKAVASETVANTNPAIYAKLKAALESMDWNYVLSPAFEATATKEEKKAVIDLMNLQTKFYSGTYKTGGIQSFITSYKGCSCKGGGLTDIKYINYIGQVEAAVYSQKSQFIAADNYTYSLFNSIVNIVRTVDPQGVGQVASKVLVINDARMAQVVERIEAHLTAKGVTRAELKSAMIAAGVAWVTNYSADHPVDNDDTKPKKDLGKGQVIVKLPEATENPKTGKLTVAITADLGKQITDAVTAATPQVYLTVPKVDAGKSVNLVIPASLLAEIKGKTAKTSLVIESAGAKFILPLAKLNLSKYNGSLVITTKLLTSDEGTTLLAKMKIKKQPKGKTKASAVTAGEMALVAPATTVNVAVESADGKSTKVTSFGDVYVEREFAVTGSIDTNRTAGAVVSADGTIKALPTTFKTDAQGNVTAVVKTLANSDDTYTVVESNVTFPDVKSGRAKVYIEALASKNIISGTTAGTYKPNDDMTRGQLAILLTRVLGLPTTSAYNGSFKDVKSTDWVNANGELMAAVNAGLVSGRADGTFGADAKVTRAEAAAMIGRALALGLVEFNKANYAATKQIADFTDAKQIGASTRPQVLKVYQAGIMNGTDKKEFKPNAYMKRDEMAIMLGQFLVKTKLMQELNK